MRDSGRFLLDRILHPGDSINIAYYLTQQCVTQAIRCRGLDDSQPRPRRLPSFHQRWPTFHACNMLPRGGPYYQGILSWMPRVALGWSETYTSPP